MQGSSDLIPALIAAGIQSPAAARIARAIASATQASAQGGHSQFSRAPGVGFQAVAGDAKTFALHASAPGTYVKAGVNGASFGPGGGALGVEGASVFDGDVYCSGAGAFLSLQVQADLGVSGGAWAGTVAASRSLSCGDALLVTQQSVQCGAPLIASLGLDVTGSSVFSGDVTVQAPLAINGQVVWGGVNRVPFDGLQVLTAAAVAGGDTISLTPATVAVLNHFGQGQARNFKYSFEPQAYAVTDLVQFDPATCQLVLTETDPNGNPWPTDDGKAPDVLVGGAVKIAVA